MRLLLSLLIPFALLTISSAAEPSADDIAFFEAKVRPLLIKHCFECHSKQSKTVQGGLRLDHSESLLKGGDSGLVVVPGKPDESRLIKSVRYDNADSQMPPAGKLDAQAIETLTVWVQRGAYFPATQNDVVTGTSVAKTRVIDIESGKQHWSFRPLTRTTPPVVSAPEWLASGIDSFVLNEMEQHGLGPSSKADRRTLLRRVSFSLIGLPPSPEDITEFLNDADPEAYSRAIERLLASPHYGERWGRYWLDLVRYADVLEQWAAPGGNAWVYRDWVVRVLNEDLPFDQFSQRQLAADQMPEASPEDVAGLGLLGLSPSYWKELKLAPDVIKSVVAEEWEEQITMLTGTFLGLTVACARCHDHKYDPITQQDYYGLAGVFASIRQAPRLALPSDLAQQLKATQTRVQQLEAEADKLIKQAAADVGKAETLRQQASDLQTTAAALKQSTPHFNAAQGYAVEDASLFVLPDGASRTKLDFKLGVGQNVALQIRGNPANAGSVVPRQYLAVLSPQVPAKLETGSGRLDLARTMFRDSAALIARVIVNRVWRHHFGRGLVETPSNFGTLGQKPTHPQLLDELAARFMESGWSLKWLHREIVLSATYQQTSNAAQESVATDPENVWLSRMPRRRLEVEAWRDAILSASGAIDRRLGGTPGELSDAHYARRTIYGTVKRRELDDLLRLFDFPDPTGHSPARLETTTPLQQLYVLNSNFIAQQARRLANRAQSERPNDVAGQIVRAHQLLSSQTPSTNQTARAQEFLTNAPTDARWQQFVEVLLASNAVQFVD